MPVKTLRIALGLFFIILGITGILPNVEESIFTLRGQSHTVESLFGIIEVVCGVILIMGVSMARSVSWIHNAAFVVFVFWIIRIILGTFVFWLAPGLPWLIVLSSQLVIAAAIWVVVKVY